MSATEEGAGSSGCATRLAPSMPGGDQRAPGRERIWLEKNLDSAELNAS